MRWYRFWKTVHGHPAGELYTELDYEPDDEENLKNEAEDWADRIHGGSHTGYKYGYQHVDKPPKEWIEHEIRECEDAIKINRRCIKKYKKILSDYNRKIDGVIK